MDSTQTTTAEPTPQATTSESTPSGETARSRLVEAAATLGQSYLKRAGALNQAQEAVMLDDLQQLLAMNRQKLQTDYERVHGCELNSNGQGSDQMHVGDVNITYSGAAPPQQVTTQNAALRAAHPSQTVQADATPGYSSAPVVAPSVLPSKLANLGKLAAIAAAFATAGAGGAYVTAKVLAPKGTDTDTQYQLQLVEPDSTQPVGG